MSGSPIRPRLSAAALALALAACATVPPPGHPRPALPLPEAVAARYALAGEVDLTLLQRSGRDRRMTTFRGVLECGPERAEFELMLPPSAVAPFVLLLPILAGGEDLMRILGEGLVERGFAVGWCRRVAAALRPPQRGPDLEILFRRTVIQNRMLLAWARTTPVLRGDATAVMGISMGGMVGAALLAVEPELRGGALCLAGADLSDLVLHTGEGRVLRWLDWRQREDGAGRWEIGLEIRTHLASDPAHLSAYVPTEKVLLVAATLDDVVPRRNRDLLWEALGRPRRMLMPLGHYTSALVLNPILDAVAGFLAVRLAAP